MSTFLDMLRAAAGPTLDPHERKVNRDGRRPFQRRTLLSGWVPCCSLQRQASSGWRPSNVANGPESMAGVGRTSPTLSRSVRQAVHQKYKPEELDDARAVSVAAPGFRFVLAQEEAHELSSGRGSGPNTCSLGLLKERRPRPLRRAWWLRLTADTIRDWLASTDRSDEGVVRSGPPRRCGRSASTCQDSPPRRRGPKRFGAGHLRQRTAKVGPGAGAAAAGPYSVHPSPLRRCWSCSLARSLGTQGQLDRVRAHRARHPAAAADKFQRSALITEPRGHTRAAGAARGRRPARTRRALVS